MKTEEPILYTLVALIGLIPVLIACARGDVLGVEFTLGALLVLVGVVGLVAQAWRR
jgi:hypothetical protein